MARTSWLLLCSALVLLAVRVAFLDRYPLIHPDEGFWSQGSRNWVRYHAPLQDGRAHPFLSPGHFLLLAGFFEIAPPSLLSARWFSALLGVGSCLAVWRLTCIMVPRRPWLGLLFFGMSTLTILIHRLALLESHQMFWLLLAAWAWCSPGRCRPLAAGLAFAMALLVKSNSVYLLPAFVLVPPETRWRSLAIFGSSVFLLAGFGYGLAWRLDPQAFADAFRFEMQGHNFASYQPWFHFSRFGLAPKRIVHVLGSFFLGEPFLSLLAVLGLALARRYWAGVGRAERLITCWLALGLTFHLAQINVEQRYLTTLAPALALLAARLIDRWLGDYPPGELWRSWAVAGLIAIFLSFHMLRLGLGIHRDGNRDYWRLVEYCRVNVADETKVLAASYIVQSVPQHGYDFYRLMFRYDGQRVPVGDVVARLDIGVIVIDSEWREYATEEANDFVRSECEPVETIGEFQLYRARPRSR